MLHRDFVYFAFQFIYKKRHVSGAFFFFNTVIAAKCIFVHYSSFFQSVFRQFLTHPGPNIIIYKYTGTCFRRVSVPESSGAILDNYCYTRLLLAPVARAYIIFGANFFYFIFLFHFSPSIIISNRRLSPLFDSSRRLIIALPSTGTVVPGPGFSRIPHRSVASWFSDVARDFNAPGDITFRALATALGD